MVTTVRLGGNASHIEVAAIGHGLMTMTWTDKPVTDEQAFEAIKKGVDAAGGAKVMLNSSEFYDNQHSTGNLKLLARFYKKYPEYAEKTVLSVKGAVEIGPGRHKPNSSFDFLRKSIDNIDAALEGTKRVDIYEAARVDPDIPIEEVMQSMKKLIDEGKFDYVGLSECSAQTLRRANAVVPIAAVEIEVSPWAYEEETKKVIATCAELNIPIAAYSPLGHGFLTGQIKKVEDFPETFKNILDRLKPENFEHNLTFVDALKSIAARKNITPGQLSLAWVRSLGPHMMPIPGSSRASRTLENLAAADITLTPEEKAEIDELLAKVPIKGARYSASTSFLWG